MNWKNIPKISINELSNEIGSEIMNRRKTIISLKKVERINELFYPHQTKVYRINPEDYPELNLFNLP